MDQRAYLVGKHDVGTVSLVTVDNAAMTEAPHAVLTRCLIRITRLLLVLLIALASLPIAHAQQERPGKRLALVIGNDAYQKVSKLEKAGNDASSMARELKTAGFDVMLYRDLNYQAMVKNIDIFADRINGGDQVVVFFAGHGIQIKTGAYLLPIDIEANSESQVEKTAYGLADLTDKLSEAKASFALVMVDACRDNPLKSKGRAIGSSRGLSAIEPPKGQMVIYSASKGQQALDRLSDNDDNPNGVFTRSFIASMKMPGVRIEDLVREVQDAVEELAHTVSHEQRPAIYNESRGSFYFFGPSTVNVQPATAAPPSAGARLKTAIEREDELWDSIKDADSNEAFNEYLKGYPKGKFVTQAKILLAKLKKAAAPTAAPPLPTPTRGDNPDDALWNAVEQARSADDYEVYVKQYPKGRYVALAKQRIQKLKDEARQQAEAAEQRAWQTAESNPTLEVYAAYLASYPSGRYAAPAQSKLAAMKKEEAELRPGKVFKDCADCPEMLYIPVGSFQMGGMATDEQPIHKVTLKAFALGKTEVTQGQWKALMGNNPSSFAQCGDDCPVENVSWDDTQAFISKLNQKTGKTYRLPSEAEWEYACRAGGQDEYCGSDSIDSVAWYGSNSGNKTHPVAGKQANAWGLYDMSGNVWEWKQDCWNDNYNGALDDGGAWTAGQCSVGRVLRGGSWLNYPQVASVTSRSRYVASIRSSSYGFRLAKMFP